MPRVAQLTAQGAFNPQPRNGFGATGSGYSVPGKAAGLDGTSSGYNVPGKAAVSKLETPQEISTLDDCALVAKPEDTNLPADKADRINGYREPLPTKELQPGKVWPDPGSAAATLEAVLARKHMPSNRPPPLGDCFLLGFWGTSGEELRANMRWDGMRYHCMLDVQAGEDALFQVETAALGRIYPDTEGANPSIRHELLGPHAQHPDTSWFLESSGANRRADVFMPCPKGCAVALGWQIHGEELPRESEDWVAMGEWEISGQLGLGKQGAVVYTGRWPEAGSGGVAAVKFPVEAEELQIYAKLHDIPGLPTLLDFGMVSMSVDNKPPQQGLFMAMSKTTPSLDTLLRGRLHIHDHDPKILGRLSWPVAADLGARLLLTLQAVHRRGVLHCDLKPGNLLLHRSEPWVKLIDFGRSGPVGEIRFDPGHGGMRDFMSVKAGLEGGRRTAADDVESLGWLLYRLLHGGFPWSAKVKPREDETWEEGGKRVARSKLQFLEEGGVKKLPQQYRYCPGPLLELLRRTRRLAGSRMTDADYESLAKLLISDTVSADGECAAGGDCGQISNGRLGQFVEGYYAAEETGVHKKGVWPYAGVCDLHWLFASALHGSSQKVSRLRVSPGFLLRLTGRSVEEDDCVWMELDPVWSPGVPEVLLQQVWVLAVGPPPGGGRSEKWLSWGLEFPVIEHVKDLQ